MSEVTREALAAAQWIDDRKTLRNEFSDIYADERLLNMADLTAKALAATDAQRGIVRPSIDLYREAGNSVRQLIGHGPDGAAQPRQRRGQRQAAAPEDGTISEAEIDRERHLAIQEMMRARGPWNYERGE